MSAIVAGNKCKKCGCKYFSSFGHPKWYDDVVKRGLPKPPIYLEFEDFRKSGKCEACYRRTYIKRTETTEESVLRSMARKELSI